MAELVRYHKQQEIRIVVERFCDQHREFKVLDEAFDENKGLLKVGSFYERTKISFPDEFDFVFIVGNLTLDKQISTGKSIEKFFFDINDTIQDMFAQQLTLSDLTDTTFTSEFGSITFDSYVERKGPSSKLLFKYFKTRSQTIKIFVDFVPAFKIIDPSIEARVQNMCNCLEFCEEIVATGSFLVVGNVSFTETEVHFMRDILSEHHRKVYRLLKYLVNHYEIKNNSTQYSMEITGISSYMMKSLMIFHHYQCTCSENEIDACLLSILQSLISIQHTVDTKLLTPRLKNKWLYLLDRTNNSLTLHYLRLLIESLNSKQKSQKHYRYQRIRPVAETLHRYYSNDWTVKERILFLCHDIGQGCLTVCACLCGTMFCCCLALPCWCCCMGKEKE